jgi:hypothetical protein
MKTASHGGAGVLVSRSLQTVTTTREDKLSVPKEQLKIARQFNAGFLGQSRQVPEERPTSRRFSRPCGTGSIFNQFPALKRRTIFGKSRWDSVLLTAAVLSFFGVGAAAETTNTWSEAEIQGRQLAQQLLELQPTTNVTQTGILKVRDAAGTTTNIPVSFSTRVTAAYWQARYLAKQTNYDGAPSVHLVIIHRNGEPNEYDISEDEGGIGPTQRLIPVGHLHGNQIMASFAGSDFWIADLGLDFFHWPAQKILPKTTNLKRGREYTLLESTNPNPSANGYSRVLTCIDKETGGILEAEAYDSKGRLLKVFAPKSFRKVNGQWELQEMEIRNVQTGSRTRLEFDSKK